MFLGCKLFLLRRGAVSVIRFHINQFQLFDVGKKSYFRHYISALNSGILLDRNRNSTRVEMKLFQHLLIGYCTAASKKPRATFCDVGELSLPDHAEKWDCGTIDTFVPIGTVCNLKCDPGYNLACKLNKWTSLDSVFFSVVISKVENISKMQEDGLEKTRYNQCKMWKRR